MRMEGSNLRDLESHETKKNFTDDLKWNLTANIPDTLGASISRSEVNLEK